MALQCKGRRMAHITVEQGRPSVLAGLRGFLAARRRDLERHRVFKQTYGELASLTDRELADIGVGRSQIVALAWDAAQRV